MKKKKQLALQQSGKVCYKINSTIYLNVIINSNTYLLNACI